MIVTVTANPSLDRTLHVGILLRGELHRARAESVEPSGKGVNVALALHGAGVPVTAVLPIGGHAGAELTSLLAGLPHVPVPIAGSVRINVTLVEDDRAAAGGRRPAGGLHHLGAPPGRRGGRLRRVRRWRGGQGAGPDRGRRRPPLTSRDDHAEVSPRDFCMIVAG